MDPKLFFSDPYPDLDLTFQEILDPDPTQLLGKENRNYSCTRLPGSVITEYGP